MGMLFEQVEGNRFRLSEGYDPDFCISESKENPDHIITKEEEAYILNYINREIIPLVIDKQYNSELRKDRNLNADDYPRIGYQSVSRNLRKIS